MRPPCSGGYIVGALCQLVIVCGSFIPRMLIILFVFFFFTSKSITQHPRCHITAADSVLVMVICLLYAVIHDDKHGFGTVKQGCRSTCERGGRWPCWAWRECTRFMQRPDQTIAHEASEFFYYMYNIIIYFIPANAFCIVMYFSSNLRSFRHTSVFHYRILNVKSCSKIYLTKIKRFNNWFIFLRAPKQ